MDASSDLAYLAGHIALAFFATVMWFRFWPLTRLATLRLFSRPWVKYVFRLGVWVFLPAMFFVGKETQNLLLIGVFLCCQPVVLRWVIGVDGFRNTPDTSLQAQISP